MNSPVVLGQQVRIGDYAQVPIVLRGRRGVVEAILEDGKVLVSFPDNDPDGPDSWALHVAVLESTTKPLTIQELQRIAHIIAVYKGWWDEPRDLPTCLALIHSEISEALQAYRETTNDDEVRAVRVVDGKPVGVFVELADAVIRIADLFERYGVSLEDVLWAKMDYNRTRPRRHGRKRV